LLNHPEIGRYLEDHKIRKAVTPKYRFVILYEIDSDYIVIDTIHRYQNRPY